MNDEEFMEKLREAFAIEAEEHLQAMSAGLIELEKSDSAGRSKEIIETVFREAHSLKGAARAVNRIDIEAVCQALESVFAQWKREGLSASAETFDTLNAAVDFLTGLRTKAAPAETVAERSAVQETVRAITRLSVPGAPRPQSAPAPTPVPAFPAASVPAPAAAALPIAVPLAGPPAHESERLNVAETVRVPMAKLDALLLRAEEMVAVKQLVGQHSTEVRALAETLETWRKEWHKVRVVTRAEAASAGEVARPKLSAFAEWNEGQLDALDRRLAALAKSVERDGRFVDAMVDELLDGAKRMVMLPFERLLAIFPKQVRDLAREVGKEIDLSMHGGEVEIDKRILEEMKAPLVHLVRNAIDHGLEDPVERARRGKSARGRLSIAVSQREGSKVEIVVCDDGGGIDVAAVKAASLKNGVTTEAEVAQLSDTAALALIFQSGISTSPILTEISGRGLGMAIVREKVEKLGGQIAIESERDVGTAFRIVLPVTLATFKGVLVEAGGQTFVLPTSSIERIVRVREEEIQTVENRETISLENRALAFVWLAGVLGLPRPASPAPRAFVEAVVLGKGELRVAFAVEAVLGEMEVLVKKLARPLVRVRNVAGATVLGSGTPVLILNPSDLLKSAVHLATSGAMRPARDATEQAEARAARLLVADDSVTSRMLLKNILETAGYEVTTAVDGLEAFTALRAGEFELVVSDVEMPRMDGFELTAKIRAEPKLAELPVVLVTALGSREHQERGIDVGANAYIVKSNFDQSNLLEIIQRLL